MNTPSPADAAADDQDASVGQAASVGQDASVGQGASVGQDASVGQGASVERSRDQVEQSDAPPTPRRPNRRVTTPPPPGTDPNPVPEPPRSTGSENDARLKADKPPHWG